MFNKFVNLQNLSMFDIKQQLPREFLTLLCEGSVFQYGSAAGWYSLDQIVSSEIVRNHDCEIAGIIAHKQKYQALAL